MATLLEQVSDQSNIARAFRSCAKGKRSGRGYQMMSLNLVHNIVALANELATGSWIWSPYHRFVICDPKRRIIHAAPFKDRVVHHAIHQVIFPFLDAAIPQNSWACRKGMGARNAAVALAAALKRLGKGRHVIKLDIRSYFSCIDHQILQDMIKQVLPDPTLDNLLVSLLDSQADYRAAKCGIPLGNLTSQLFANFYLSSVDHLADFFKNDIFYIF
jgi:hypothetical protein